MEALFATAGSYPPGPFGGAELSVDELARELLSRGHGCEVVAGITARLARAADRLVRLISGRSARRDSWNGYAVWRTASAAVPRAVAERIRRRRPDLVVTWNRGSEEILREAVAAAVPALLWAPDISPGWRAGAPPRGVGLAGASEFVAGRLRERHGLDVRVLRPCIRLAAYEAPDPRPERVTLVNPRPAKGLEAALGAAALLPHRRFHFVETRYARRAERKALRARLAALPHVTVESGVPDMRTVYARTAVLLVPSQVEDAAPRVILEAHASGIPAVASRTGGIPEVLGAGGVLLPPDAPAERWAEALEAILSDADRRAALGGLARKNAARAELQPEAVVLAFLSMAAELGEARRVGRARA